MSNTKPTQQDVLLAILALDAYSRHRLFDNRQISDASGNALSTNIGGAVWQYSSDQPEVLPASTATGFSASYYTLNGAKVISYRGTDFPSSWLSPGQVGSFLADAVNGWAPSFNISGASYGDGVDGALSGI